MKYLHEYVTFWYVWKIRTTNFEILIGTSFSQMSNFRWVKNSHVFVIPVKNSFELFTCVTNTCEFFTRVTDSFECERQTNLSQVWKKAISFTRDPLCLCHARTVHPYKWRTHPSFGKKKKTEPNFQYVIVWNTTKNQDRPHFRTCMMYM